MTDIVEWLKAQLDADEQIARAASQDRDGSTPTGEHWRWECTHCDTPIEITSVVLLDEFLECPTCGSLSVALRSVEAYPTRSVGALSHFVVSYAQEQRPVDALHIIRHDPASVLRTIAAHRAILNRHAPHDYPPPTCRQCSDVRGDFLEDWPCADVLAIASIYQDRDGFDPAWKVNP